MAGILRKTFNDFTGGEAAIFPIRRMPPKYSLLLQNCYIGEDGSPTKVPGYGKVNTGGSAEKNLTTGFEFRQKDGTIYKLTAGGGSIFRATGDTLTAIKTGLDNGSKVYFKNMNDICVITNGVDAPMKYDGTTVAALGGSPPATAFKFHVHKGRGWFIERANKMLATHTALNNPEDCTGEGSGYIDFKYVLNEGDSLVDVVTYIDLIVFIFRNHVAIYSGNTPSGESSDFQLVQLIKGIGAVDHSVCLQLGSDLAMLHESGVKSLKQVVTTGNLNLGDVSTLIDPTLTAQVANNPGGYYSFVHYPRRGWAMLLVGSVLWIYDYTTKSWARMFDFGTNIQYIFPSYNGEIYFCGDNYLFKLDETLGTFDGNDVTMKWKTGWLPLSKSGEYAHPKVIEYSLYSPVKPTTFTMTAWTEGSTAITCEASGTLLDDVADFDSLSPLDDDVFDHMRLPMFGKGRQMAIQIENTSSIAGIKIPDFTLQWERGGF